MMKDAVLCLVLVIILTFVEKSLGYGVIMSLKYNSFPVPGLVLNTTVLNNKDRHPLLQNEPIWFKGKYNLEYIECLQGNNKEMTPERVRNFKKIRFNLIENLPIQFGTQYIYDLMLENEGYVKCKYQFHTNIIHSNTEFYRFNNMVYVLKLNETKLSKDVEKDIEILIGNSQYKTSMKIDNTVHITVVNRQVSDELGLNNLRAIVEEMVKPKYSVIDIFSTRECNTRNLKGNYRLRATVAGNSRFLTHDGERMEVRCDGDFYDGVHWNERDLEQVLNILNEPTATKLDVTLSLETPREIQNFADQLSSISNLDAKELPVLAQKMDTLLGKNVEVLQQLREAENTSNHILVELDRVLVDTANLTDGVEQAVQPNFAARVEDVGVTLGVGLAMVDDMDPQVTMELVPLTIHTTSEDVVELIPRTALRLPNSILEGRNASTGRLALSVFPNGDIFSALSTSAVVSATLGGQHLSNLSEPVRIWFRRNITERPESGQCVTWDFSANSGRGNWTDRGCNLHTVHTNATRVTVVLDECWCYHLTHFGELFWNHDDSKISEISPVHVEALDFITQAGCAISLVGLAGVFITALCAPEWLRSPSHKIQLQISISFALLIVVFLIITSATISSHISVTMGVLLHYSLLSNFSWMLLAAFLQYTRLVKVVKSRSTRLPLKSGLIGWIVPAVPPIALLASGNFHVYTKAPLYLPRGIYFYLGIALPLAIVMVCNVVVFILIAHSLYMNIKIRRHENHCLSLRRFKQLVFLFVLLGLSWLFALAQLTLPVPWNLLFSYLFCISVALQGLTFFLFFVIFDESTRNAWKMRLCPTQARYDIVKRCTRYSKGNSTSSNSAHEVNSNPNPRVQSPPKI